MATDLVYVGPFESVYLPTFEADVARGEVVQITDDAVAASLLEQEVWQEGHLPVPDLPTYPDELPAVLAGPGALVRIDNPGPGLSEAPVVDPPEDTVDGPAAGTVAEVKAWVGDDPVLAAEALAAELAKGDNARGSLVAFLTPLAEASAAADTDPEV